MNITPPDREFLRALHRSGATDVELAIQLGETLLMSANALHRNPAALIRICQEINPESSPADAVTLVHEELKALPSSVAVFRAQWTAVAQELLSETRFLRQAAIERSDALGYELRQLNAKLASEKGQAQAKRKALIDVGVSPDEATRLAPEPRDAENAEQTAAINAERAIYTEFGRTLDATLLPTAVHERAKELEIQKDWKVCTQATTA